MAGLCRFDGVHRQGPDGVRHIAVRDSHSADLPEFFDFCARPELPGTVKALGARLQSSLFNRAMTDLTPAAERLDAALTRLEAALDAHLLRAGDPASLRAEITALIADRANLAEALDQSLAREQELQALADEASQALGSAIDEVRAALGEET
jgi:hypothetical protein